MNILRGTTGARVRLAAIVIVAAAVLPACGGPDESTIEGAVDDGRWAVREFVREQERFLLVYERRTQLESPYNVPVASPVPDLWMALEMLAAGDTDAARETADRLASTFVERGDALIAAVDQPHDTFSGEGIAAPWASASAQALALALFDQVAAATGDTTSAATADRLAQGYLLGLDAGGIARFDEAGVFFEEYPTMAPMYVLQGGALATLALADHVAHREDDELRALLGQATAWWEANIERYDSPTTVLDDAVGEPMVALAPPVTMPPLASGQTELVTLLAGVLDVDAVERAADRWERSEHRIPGAFETEALPGAALDLADPPVLPVEPGADSVHVEYPGIWHEGDDLVALYSAFGDDGYWRIRGARSSDGGRSWERTGTAIEPRDIGWYGAAFPDAVIDEESGDVIVVFSATDEPAGYDVVLAMRGPGIDGLADPVVVAAEAGLDPAIWFEDGRYHVSFTLVVPEGISLEHYASDDAHTWKRLDPLLVTRRSVYTQNTFVLDDTRVWALNLSYGAVRGRESVWLFCRETDSGTLVPLDDGEIDVSDLQLDVWNQLKYGFEFDESGDELIAYYNGIRRDQGDGNGMIGRTRLDLSGPRVPDSCR